MGDIVVHFQMDGDQWMASYDDFQDLHESNAGFGDTPDKALADLIQHENQFTN